MQSVQARKDTQLNPRAAEPFGAVVRLAASLFGAAGAAVVLPAPAGRRGAWRTLASHGPSAWFGPGPTAPALSLLARLPLPTDTPRPGTVLCVADLAQDRRWNGRLARHRAVARAPLLRFCATAPLTDAQGHLAGLLFVADTAPRQPGPVQLQQFGHLAAAASATLGLQSALHLAHTQRTAAPAPALAMMEALAKDGLAGLVARLRAGLGPGARLAATARHLRAALPRPLQPQSPQPVPPYTRAEVASRLRAVLAPHVLGAAPVPFTLAFQPVIAVDDPGGASLEALIRWEVEPGRSIPPADFVPLAEQLGLIPQLDRWVLREACTAAMRWPEPWPVAVNVSAATFGTVDVAAMVRDTLAGTGLPPARLTVEMTETALAGDPAMVRRSVERLRAQGVRVALDDFGAGHSSLSSLRRFPFSVLKIDRGLTERVAHDTVQAHLVGLVAQLGRALGVPVTAEGVETADDLREVCRLGCTQAQGYVLSRPVCAGQVTAAMGVAAQVLRDALGEPLAVAH